MALLFAMGGSYPGCWRSFDEDEDLGQDGGEERTIDGEGGEDSGAVDKGYASKEQEERKEMEERPIWAGSLCLALMTLVGEGREEEERKDSLIPALDTKSSMPTQSHVDQSGEEKSDAGPDRAGLTAFTGRKRRGGNERRRRNAERFSSYVPTGAPSGAQTEREISDRTDGRVDGLFDENGFLTEEEAQRKGLIFESYEDTTKHAGQAEERYPEYVKKPIMTRMEFREWQQRESARKHSPELETGDSEPVPRTTIAESHHRVLREIGFEAEKRPVDLGVEAEEYPLDLTGPSSMSFFRERKEEARRHSLDLQALHRPSATVLGNAEVPESEAGDRRRISLDPSDLRIPRRRIPRPEGFVPFSELAREPGRFLRNQEKTRRKEEGKQALHEATRALHDSLQRNVSSYSWRSGVADPHVEEVGVQRNISLFSWQSRTTDELFVENMNVVIAGKRRRYAFVRRRGVQGSQGNPLGIVMAKMNDMEIATTPREVIEPSCLLHRAQPLRRTRTEGFKPDLHWRVVVVKGQRSNEHSIEDFWSWIEGDDQEFNVIDQQQGILQELPGEWAQTASEHGLVRQNSYEYVQYEVQMYHERVHQQESRWIPAQRHALSSDSSLSSASQHPSYSTFGTTHTQDSVVDQSYPPMRVWETARAQGNEDEKLIKSGTSSLMTEKKPGWCWPFRRARRASEPQMETTNQRGDAKKGMWRPKAERRKLSKLPPTPR